MKLNEGMDIMLKKLIVILYMVKIYKLELHIKLNLAEDQIDHHDR